MADMGLRSSTERFASGASSFGLWGSSGVTTTVEFWKVTSFTLQMP